ncbi:hypothetical protein A2Z33_06785 [Candidatus Gottesmanbacteria bacterium RBG_16_52_11]|uniref:methionine--tRNA ligase n=1 Tax=Candidatus Gottesmanbacteria bacterium RBG_16_52_11 TaxID=1798374 RepID=A0A1F5YXP8_9BACT|nr:MAG: hypothetical protein A2Z33_06785 [Candidatus Gottesmanbacteria bacterium RBG_16_52_11]
MTNKFYVTCAIPYVNARPHIGHALEFVQGDAIARYQKLRGRQVLFLSGGDENALKNVQAAQDAQTPVQQFVDRNSGLFRTLAENLDVQFDVFQKGSDREKHYPASQKLWQLCAGSGDIYEKEYEGLYCVGCEAFYTPDELDENGECFEHPGKKLDTVREKNYFFRLSRYRETLTDIIRGTHSGYGRLRIIPEKRENEILAFLARGLTDISISRSNERAKNWGVPVPGDPTQRIYVWFDALNIYQSGAGFGWNDSLYRKWWPADIHVIGKGILRFHAVYWPAFLLSAKLPLPKSIFVHEYFTVNGQKMSKTLGNVIDPNQIISKFGSEAVRYYLLAKFSPFADGDFSEPEFTKTYNSDLANGLGNLVSRVAALAQRLKITPDDGKRTLLLKSFGDQYQFNLALETIWKVIKECDVRINERRIWTLSGGEKSAALDDIIRDIRNISYNLTPFLPRTAGIITDQFKGSDIPKRDPLFPRIG